MHKVTSFLDANLPMTSHKRSIHSIDSLHADSLKHLSGSSRLELLYKENRDSLQRADNESPLHSSALSQENQKLRRVIEEMQTKIVEAYEK